MSNAVLYALWGVLYALCAVLGFLKEPGTVLQTFMSVLSIVLFVPPLVLNHRAGKCRDRRTLLLNRNLSAAWLVIACVLLVANFLSVLASEALGNFLHYLLTVAASPMVCSSNWALAIFCWAWVLFDARAKLKKN